MGYVIIPKQNCSGREDINSRCRRFDIVAFSPFLAQSVAALTAVVAVQPFAVRQVAGDQA